VVLRMLIQLTTESYHLLDNVLSTHNPYLVYTLGFFFIYYLDLIAVFFFLIVVWTLEFLSWVFLPQLSGSKEPTRLAFRLSISLPSLFSALSYRIHYPVHVWLETEAYQPLLLFPPKITRYFQLWPICIHFYR
jgi:hypothetical protein